jgi:hypothetical protein
MKQFTSFFIAGFIGIHSGVCAQDRIPVFELHVSANHPLKNEQTDRTFFGGGFGGDLVFRDAHTFSIKTGLEANFFHTWNKSVYMGHMDGKSDVNYHFWNLSIPVMLRLHAGNKVKLFLEAGAYLGIPLFGNTTSIYHSDPSYPGDVAINEERSERFEGYVSVSPAVSLGLIFPVSPRVDLYVRPEFLFQKNFNVYDGPVSDFNARFRYVRLCVGMRINVNKEID